MKKTTAILTAMIVSASIGSQILAAITRDTTTCIPSVKVGVLTFALSDDYQINVLLNGAASQTTVTNLEQCDSTVKYVDQVVSVNTAKVISAIGEAMAIKFTSKAQLAIVNYDNALPAPPYPPYLDFPASVTWNGPREFDAEDGGFGMANPPAREWIVSMHSWPNNVQIDWVDYDNTENIDGDTSNDYGITNDPYPDWPKARVYISDPNNLSIDGCVDVTGFFSFEEAYCYFCWDTVDRVTKGSLTVSSSSEICIGNFGCTEKGSGTTKFYMTIKFNNIISQNDWINGHIIDDWTDGEGWISVDYTISSEAQGAQNWLSFSVGGVVSYPWTIKNVGGAAWAMGTMTMAQANGYGQIPWCGVYTGSVKITETDDCKVPVCFGEF
jgi:hypothetical protein